MTKLQRVQSIAGGVLMLLFTWLILRFAEDGIQLVAAIVSISLIVMGIRYLIYYFTMARHMVGGKRLFFIGAIVLDFGIFTSTLSEVPTLYVILYLVGIHAFSGTVEVLRALEAKKVGAGSWKLKFATGLLDLTTAAACLVFFKNPRVAVYIYCAGLVYSAVLRIISAFRKTAIVYIQ